MNVLLPYLAVALSLLAIAAFFWAFGWIRNRVGGLFAGGRGQGTGDLLMDLGRRIRQLEERFEGNRREVAERLESSLQELGGRDDQLQEYAAGAVRHLHLHPYALGDSGPESAAVVLADEQGNGLLLNVLSGKTTRVYARPVRSWHAEHLSQEEEQALVEARTKAGK